MMRRRKGKTGGAHADAGAFPNALASHTVRVPPYAYACRRTRAQASLSPISTEAAALPASTCGMQGRRVLILGSAFRGPAANLARGRVWLAPRRAHVRGCAFPKAARGCGLYPHRHRPQVPRGCARRPHAHSQAHGNAAAAGWCLCRAAGLGYSADCNQ